MKKALKIAGLCAAVLVTFAIALLIWVATLDPNQHKDWIARQFEARTGRPLSLAGPLELSLYPWLGLAARDVGVGEASGSGEFFRAEQLALRVKLLPLLTGRYEIDTVRLHGAQLNLRIDEGGNDNWSDLAGQPEQDAEPSGEEGLSLANVVVGGIDIRDLGIDYEDRAQGRRYQLRGLDMSSGALAFGDPIALQSSFELLSSAPELSAALTLDGTLAYDGSGTRYDLAPLRLTGQLSGPNVPGGSAPLELSSSLQLDLEEETLRLPDLSLSLLDLQLQAAVEGEEIQGADARFQASLDLAGSDLAVFFRILDNPELAQRISTLASESFSLNARLALDGGAGSLQVEELRGELLGATLSAELRGEGLNEDRPRFEGRLDAAGPNLPALVEVAGQWQGANSDLALFGRQLAQVPDKDFRIATQFSADPGNGLVQVPALELRLLGASILGNLDASGVQGSSPRVQGAVDASGPDLPLLLQVAGHWQGGAESFLNQFGRGLRQTLPARAFSLRSEFDADLRAGDIQVPTLQAELPGFTLSGNASGSGLSGNRGNLQGSLRLQGDGLSPVLRALDQPDLADVARSLDLSLELNGGRRDLRVSPRVSLVLAGDRIPQSPATLSLSADGNLDLEADSLNLQALRLQGLGVDLQGNATLEALSAAPRARGQLALQPLDLRALLTQLGLPLPDTADPDSLRQLGFSAGFQVAATALALEDLQLRLDDSLLSGRLSLATPDLPTVAFDLDLDRLDADRYLPPPSDEPAPDRAGEGDGALPIEQLRALALDGRLEVGELTLSGLRMQALSLQARAQQGRLVLSPALRLYEGEFSGELTLDAAPALPTLAVEAALNGIALGPLLQDALQANYLSGKGDLSLDLRGSGADLAALKAGLQGQGRVDLAEGLLQGVDVAGVLAQLEAIIRSGRLVSVERGNATAFDTFAATLLVEGGVVSSSDLLLDADGFTVSGAGVLANLNDNTLNFDLSAQVEETPTNVGDRQYDIGGYTLPIACGGSLNAPRCLPDTQAILSNALSSAVQRGLGDLLNRALGGDANAEPQAPADETPPAPSQPPAQPPADDAQQQQSDPRQDLLNRALEGLLR